MPDFPATIFNQRTIENITGETYDATKTTRLYAEDLMALGAEITSIETILGENVNGSYDTVLAWLTALAGRSVGMEKVTAVETVNGTRTVFTFNSLPVWCNKDGQVTDPGNGFSVSGSGPWTLTFNNAPQSILSGFANL